VDNVGSNQMQKVRLALRGSAVLLMGKNTVMRKIIRQEAEKNPKLGALIDVITGNIGFVFTNGDLNETRGTIQANKVPAAAKSGTSAPSDVIVPPGPTGLDPGQTAFFQALQIQTKIARGSIEIINPVHLIKTGEKVTSSHVALLSKLNIRPFHYGIKVSHAYEDGAVYEAKLLDMTHDDLLEKFFRGVRLVAALSLAVHQPTLASLPHIFANATKNLIAISLATDYTFKESKAFKDYLANPDAFKKESKKEDKPAKAEEEPEKEKEEEEEEKDEESDGAIGGGLFGDNDEE
jgi:large subunit ribosomal protein LP0